MVIYKFPLKQQDDQSITVPIGGKVIHCDVQAGQICLWIACAQVIETESVGIKIVGTGYNFDGVSDHLGTVQVGGFVWHVFRGE